MENIPSLDDSIRFSDECYEKYIESTSCCECKNSNSCDCHKTKPCDCKHSKPCDCRKPCPCDCAKDVITSVALVEAALAHILNAEGEKLQKAVKLACSIDELLKVNESVRSTLIHATFLEHTLFAKLETVCRGCKKDF